VTESVAGNGRECPPPQPTRGSEGKQPQQSERGFCSNLSSKNAYDNKDFGNFEDTVMVTCRSVEFNFTNYDNL